MGLECAFVAQKRQRFLNHSSPTHPPTPTHHAHVAKLPFAAAPPDDRSLPDLHLALYTEAVLFDHATKTVYAVAWAPVGAASPAGAAPAPGGGDPALAELLAQLGGAGDSAGSAGSDGASSSGGPTAEDLSAAALGAAYDAAAARLAALVGRLTDPGWASAPRLAPGDVSLDTAERPAPPETSNMTREGFLNAIAAVKEHILAGDVFQLVLSQRFERRTFADPFEVYRALRVVNPSPYMAYLQVCGVGVAGVVVGG